MKHDRATREKYKITRIFDLMSLAEFFLSFLLFCFC
jgi:hypothetical protein